MGFHQELIGFVLILKKEEMVLYPKIAWVVTFGKCWLTCIIADFMHTTIKKTTYLKKQSTQMSLDKDNAHEKEYKFTNWNKVSFH